LANANDYVEAPASNRTGDTILYTAWEPNQADLWSVPTDGSSEPKLLLRNARYATFSPDGGRIALEEVQDPKFPDKWRIAIYTFPDLAPVKFLPTVPAGSRARWAPDGSGIDYISTDDQGTSNIWFQPLDSASPPKKLTSFGEDQIFDYAWSWDGKDLVCLRGRTLSDAFDLVRK
jgi:Tol biopolymer transport system component